MRPPMCKQRMSFEIASTPCLRPCIFGFFTGNERNSTFEMHEQTDLVEEWTSHYNTRNFFVGAAENGRSKIAP